jgi:hypothetical protein
LRYDIRNYKEHRNVATFAVMLNAAESIPVQSEAEPSLPLVKLSPV